MKTVDYPVWLAVLPDQRDAARADAGAHPDGRSSIAWDKTAKLWYARPGADLSRLQKWLPDRSIRSSGGGDPASEFWEALTSAGLVLDSLPIMDGKKHRVPVVEGSKGNRDGVYKGFLTGYSPGGWFINYHRADNDQDITTWKARRKSELVDPVARVHIRAVMQQSKDDAERKRAALYARQTAKAHGLISRMPAADPQHAYLVRKGISVTEDVRQTNNGALAIPLYNVDGAFRTLQYIPPEGQKVLFTDAPKSGHFRVEGGPLVNGEPVLYAEGYATARSLHMVTGRPVVMTVDAGNMKAVGEILKARFPESPHLFMADFDHKKEKNKGLLSAQSAAAATGGAVIVPELKPDEIAGGLTDFNDLHQSRGIDALRTDLIPRINEALMELNYKDTAMAKPDDAQPAPNNAQSPETSHKATSSRRPGVAKERTDEIVKLRDEGMKPAQIAEQLGIGQTSVYRILNTQKAEAPVTESSMPEVTSSSPSIPATSAVTPEPLQTPIAQQAITAQALNNAASAPVPAADQANINVPQPAAAGTIAAPVTPVTNAAAAPESAPTVAEAVRDVVPSGSAAPFAEVPPGESETPEAELRAGPESRPATSATPIAAALGEENAILVEARRVAPQPEDIPAANAPRTDQDKLLSRVSHEDHPDGKSVIYRLDSEPAFIDRGNRLVMAEGASAHDEKVLAALLTAAKFYHGKIELTGSDEFKAFAINVIVNNGLQVSMKNPSQQLTLDEAKRAAGQPVSTPDAVHGDPVVPVAESAPTAASTAPPVAPAAAAPAMAETPVPGEVSQAPATPAPEKPVRPDIHTPAEKAREPITGKVTACGQAPFRFETGSQESTFITLRTREGSQTFWGKELAGLMRETRMREGQMVTLQWMGKQPVTVNKPVKDAQGNFTGHYEPIQTKRNQWALTSARGNRVQTGGDEMLKLAAFSANRYTQIQHALFSQLGISIDAPPKPADGLYWIRPDGQGSVSAGDALSAPRPAHNENAGKPFMTAWGEDGKPDLYLVQGDGHYLQGIVRQNDIYQHVLVSLPDSKEAPRMVINLLTPDGAQPIGSGNGINRSDGKPVPREHVVFRVTGDEKQRIAKLHEPASIPPALHARLGYDERYKAETVYPKEQPAAAPQAAPVTPPRPAQ